LPIVLPRTIHNNPPSSANHQRIHKCVCDEIDDLNLPHHVPNHGRLQSAMNMNHHRPTPTNHQSILTMLSINRAAVRAIEITRRLLESFTSGFRRHPRAAIALCSRPLNVLLTSFLCATARDNYEKWYAKKTGWNVSSYI
jgi:hypothetical protein